MSEYIPELDDEKSEKLFIRFDIHAVKDEEQSTKQGRPVFKDLEYIEIVVPGDKSNKIHRAVREEDKKRFAKQYAAWKLDPSTGGQTGTPLAQVPFLTRSEVEELKYFSVHTVEQLAGMSDGNLQNIGPILALRQKAKDYLAVAKGNAPVSQLRAENEELKNQLATLNRSMAEILAKLKEKDPDAVDHIPEVPKAKKKSPSKQRVEKPA